MKRQFATRGESKLRSQANNLPKNPAHNELNKITHEKLPTNLERIPETKRPLIFLKAI